MSIKLYNTLTNKTEIFTPSVENKLKMYVCGMTVYDLCHIGHARMMISFDAIIRWFTESGYDVQYVRNITDIDDKIIARAVARGISIKELTSEMISAMHEDFRSLNIKSPSVEPRATDYIPHMLNMIETLENKGVAYKSESGDVNFSVRKFPNYGKLSGRNIDKLQSSSHDNSKHDSLDFALWKSAKPNEPLDAQYNSKYGMGRPGWHIECSAMSCELLGNTFDIHGGGMDLKFPHHENEIAQSEAANDTAFAKWWVHNGFLTVDNQKMSKSLNNFVTIRDALNITDGESLRFAIIRTHYRSNFDYSIKALLDAEKSLETFYMTMQMFDATQINIDWNAPHALEFKNALDDDINTANAIAVLFELSNIANKQKSKYHADLMKSLGMILGILESTPVECLHRGLDPQHIEPLIAARTEAKLIKDYVRSDEIRKKLLDLGVVVKDTASGPMWYKQIVTL